MGNYFGKSMLFYLMRPMAGRKKERQHGHKQDTARRTGGLEEAEADRDGTPRHRNGAGRRMRVPAGAPGDMGIDSFRNNKTKEED